MTLNAWYLHVQFYVYVYVCVEDEDPTATCGQK
jgi:hypothetical protein